MKTFTQLKSIEELVKHDHSFLKPEFVKALTQPFGFEGSVYLAKANPQDFKGLSLFSDEGNPILEAMGQNADFTACEIARHLNLEYTPMYGRGSRLRECCRVVYESLSH